jgi:hypothetical protein
MSKTGAARPVQLPDSWTGERRVTIDLDDADPLGVLKSWRRLAEAGGYDVEGRVSQSGEGVHIRAWFDAEEIDGVAIETLRMAAGDDRTRIDYDRRHDSKPQQVLFEGATPWRADVWAVVDDLRRESSRLSTGWFV